MGGRGGPHPGPSAMKSSGNRRWQKQREEEVLGPAGKGPRPSGPKLSPTLQPGATTSWALDNRAPDSCGRRWLVLPGPSAPVWGSLCPPPCPLPTSFFHCPAHKGLEGPTAPSLTPSPKAQAPWQRPRRQGGVCQRHLSLTSSITGHHGNTHDSTQEGLPVQPSLSPSTRPQLSPNWKPPFLWDLRSPNSLFQLQVPVFTRQWLSDSSA